MRKGATIVTKLIWFGYIARLSHWGGRGVLYLFNWLIPAFAAPGGIGEERVATLWEDQPTHKARKKATRCQASLTALTAILGSCFFCMENPLNIHTLEEKLYIYDALYCTCIVKKTVTPSADLPFNHFMIKNPRTGWPLTKPFPKLLVLHPSRCVNKNVK